MIPALDLLKERIEKAVTGAKIELLPNPAPAAEASLLVDRDSLVAVMTYLRDEEDLKFDYLSNLTGVDWPERVETTKEKDAQTGEEKTVKRTIPGFLEVVYHLYSMELRHGSLVVRARTENRTDRVMLPSVFHLWRSADFQEREVYDLYGICFEGHPDLRRLLMWDEFEHHPMRKDYVEPDDYEYEPTPHDEVLVKARRHYAANEEASS